MGQFFIQIVILLGVLGLMALALQLLGTTLHNITGFHIAEGLRANLKKLTRYKAYCAGVLSTLTSLNTLKSYITILGYSNSRLLTQSQATAAMLGAAIGKLPLVWFVALMMTIPVLHQVSLPICGLGFLALLLFPRSGDLKHSARIFLAVGLLLIAMALSKNTVHDIIFSHVTQASTVITYTSNGGFSIFLGVLIGILISAAFRSSTLTILLTLLLGVTITGDHLTIGLVLGAPIGLIFPLTNIAPSTNATSRRVIVTHAITLVFATALCGVAASFIPPTFLKYFDTNIWIALIYTAYTLLFIPLGALVTKPANKLINIVIPNVAEPKKLRLLSRNYKPDAALLMLEVDEELTRHLRRTYKMLSFVKELLTEQENDNCEKLYQRIEKYKQISDNVNHEVLIYIANISTDSSQVARRMYANIKRTNQVQQIVKEIWQVAQIIRQTQLSEQKLSPTQIQQLNNILLTIQTIQFETITATEHRDSPHTKQSIDQRVTELIAYIEDCKRAYYPYNQSQIIEISINLKSLTNAIAELI